MNDGQQRLLSFICLSVQLHIAFANLLLKHKTKSLKEKIGLSELLLSLNHACLMFLV